MSQVSLTMRIHIFYMVVTLRVVQSYCSIYPTAFLTSLHEKLHDDWRCLLTHIRHTIRLGLQQWTNERYATLTLQNVIKER